MKNIYLIKTLAVILLLVLGSCRQNVLPKPKAFLRLEYPQASYKKTTLKAPFSFETNTLATRIKLKKINAPTQSYGINIEYPSLKAVMFLTYKAIHADKNNLTTFLKDAQKFTLEHTIKADEIPVFPYESKERNVYGVLSEVKGNVASPAQFYVTDSINHFLTGSLYFKAKPNYDSILPAANYLQKDMAHIIESLQWKKN